MRKTPRDPGGSLRRFHITRVVEHQLNALTFIVLVATGLAQRFHDTAWSHWLVAFLGGIDHTRLLHRGTGLFFTALLLVHVAAALYGMLWRGWTPSIIINRKDFADALDNLRYYLGFRDEPARCDRYDYKQKFEYWGVVVGGALMAVTGLILWFPTLLFQAVPFLPGQIIPAAKAAHSNEAMLAFLVIVTWHIYNAVFSPEVFPLDTSIFTGRISRKRMRHEHPLEYERRHAEPAAPALGDAGGGDRTGADPDAPGNRSFGTF